MHYFRWLRCCDGSIHDSNCSVDAAAAAVVAEVAAAAAAAVVVVAVDLLLLPGEASFRQLPRRPLLPLPLPAFNKIMEEKKFCRQKFGILRTKID